MTREDEIKLNARWRADQYDHPAKWSDTYYGFISGAEWADRTMIDKACEWMDRYIDNYLFVDMEDAPGIRREDFINDFRQAMKEE